MNSPVTVCIETTFVYVSNDKKVTVVDKSVTMISEKPK